MSLKHLFPTLFVKEPFCLAMAKQKNLFLDCQKNLNLFSIQNSL